jgi:hypothetical protein
MNNTPQPENLVFVGPETSSWPARPIELVTLLDMLQFYAYVFYLFITKFDAVSCLIDSAVDKRGEDKRLKPDEIDELRLEMTILREELEKAGVVVSLESTAKRMEEIKEDCDDSLPPMLGSIVKQLLRLRKDLEKDLREKVFMSLSAAEVEYYNQPQLFGSEVKSRFPKANEEITAAGTCYAINDYNGCVFHLMRVVEYGARTMLKELNVQKHGNHPIELCDWGELKRALDAELPKLSTGKLTDTQIMSDLEFYTYPIQEFEKFRIWRNKASHLREAYLPGQTKDIMDATERYMRHLAQRDLDEVI